MSSNRTLAHHCPLVDDGLKQLLWEEMMNVHQLVFPTTTTATHNVFILGTQTMNPNIGHTIIHVNYQTTWSQTITPIVSSKPVCYLLQHTQCGIMSYPYCALNMYPTYLTRTKGLDSSIFRNYTCYVPRNVYLVPEQPTTPPTYTPHFVRNQFLILVQPMINMDKQPIQQPIIAPVPTIV